jgi:NAD(P)H-dependent FMN reductase
MKTVIVVGSHRPKSESARVAEVLKRHLTRITGTHGSIDTIDLGQSPLPLWDEEMWSDAPSKWGQLWSPLSDKLKAADSFIVISPEYAGMAAATLKNFFLFATSGQLAHKPGLIVSVSSGTGGAYPVAELRMSSYKNSHLCYIPEQLIVRKVNDLFHSEEPASWGPEETLLRKRFDFSLNQLLHYSRALKQMRESPSFQWTEFPYGM